MRTLIIPDLHHHTDNADHWQRFCLAHVEILERI
jgi:hypothetical protein